MAVERRPALACGQHTTGMNDTRPAGEFTLSGLLRTASFMPADGLKHYMFSTGSTLKDFPCSYSEQRNFLVPTSCGYSLGWVWRNGVKLFCINPLLVTLLYVLVP